MTRKISKVLIVYKKSSYQEHALDEKDENYLRLIREQSIVIKRSKSTHDVHLESLETVKSQLSHLQIPYALRLRTDLSPIKGYDLVLTIGGDGTFLETSHYINDGLLLGINSVPTESVGYYCKATAENFLEKMYAYLEGRSKIQKLHRLRLEIDGQLQFPLALNDLLFANQNPAGTTRYVLKIGNKKEEQKSSGLWVSAAPGSTAATKSSGGRALPLSSDKIQYVIREPYAPPGKKYKLLKGILPAKQKIEILSMMDDASIFVDGPHQTYTIRRGSLITIRNAASPIQAIW